ncbi:MAG: hypothetical protein A3E25_11570 [Burkholderiales bacterium RIFCSPHIGHO2_12_FULL_69_20]|nr:MAG: hypothetical protein A3E25_11570 [Burkholderiales bacterium RIFCSPHIGHO2_12_FULL_69_20]
MPTATLARPADHRAAGLSADGAALADGIAREALRDAMQQLSQAEQADRIGDAGHASAMCHALTETARALAGLHAYGPAESYLAQAQRWALMMGGHDLRADLACALAEVATNAADLARAQGQRARSRAARERARDHAFEAARLAALTTDPNWDVRVLLRASDVLDRCGDHDDAVQLQQRALVLMGLGQADLPPVDPQATSQGNDTDWLTSPGALM